MLNELRDNLGSDDEAVRASASEETTKLAPDAFISLLRPRDTRNADPVVNRVWTALLIVMAVVSAIYVGAARVWPVLNNDTCVAVGAFIGMGAYVGVYLWAMLRALNRREESPRYQATVRALVDAFDSPKRLPVVFAGLRSVRLQSSGASTSGPISSANSRALLMAFARIVPTLSRADLQTLNFADRDALTVPLDMPYDYVPATLAALSAIGTLGAPHLLRRVDRLANEEAATANMKEVQAAARACVERLKAAEQDREQKQTLLRGAQASEAPDVLLRAASGVTPARADELLRAPADRDQPATPGIQ